MEINEFVILIVIIGMGIYIWNLSNIRDECQYIERNVLRTLNLTLNDTWVDGVYYYGKFYCVWTGNDSTPERINHTEYHEACHAIVYDDYNHFC